jgi:hypothetical protein
VPITDEAVAGDDGVIARLVADAGRAAAEAPAPYAVVDVTAVGRATRSGLEEVLGTITVWRVGRTARYALVSLVVALAVAVTVIVRLDAGGGQQPRASLLPAAGSLGTSVLLTPGASLTGQGIGASASEVPMQLINPVTSAVTPITPFQASVQITLPWVQVGDFAVDVIGLNDMMGQPQVGRAEAFSAARPSLVDLGRASYVVAGVSADEAWLVVNPNWNDTGGFTDCSVEEVSMAGTALSAVDPMSCDLRVVGASPAGLLVTRHETTTTAADGSSLSLWQPASGRIVTTYASGDINVQGVSGAFALFENCGTGCPEFATNLRTGRTFELPKVPDGLTAQWPFSLDPYGPYAADLAVTPATLRSLSANAGVSGGCCYYNAQAMPALLLLYNLDTRTLVERRAISTESVFDMQWTPDSAYLFVTRDMAHVQAVPLWSATASIRLVETPSSDDEGALRVALPAESFLVLPGPASS